MQVILDAAVRIVEREGVAGLNTNRIAEVAGVSVGSVYQYFPDKQAIYLALHDRHVEEVSHVLARTLFTPTESSFEELLRALLEALVHVHARPGLDDVLALVPRTRNGGLAPRLRNALRLALQSHKMRKLCAAKLHVLTTLVDALAHSAARRPKTVALNAVLAEGTRAVMAYLRA